MCVCETTATYTQYMMIMIFSMFGLFRFNDDDDDDDVLAVVVVYTMLVVQLSIFQFWIHYCQNS